jgi:hypothetical protein
LAIVAVSNSVPVLREKRRGRLLTGVSSIATDLARVKEVIKSIPLIDGSVGDLTPFIVR